jgi:Mrp family chromosome partitioning ATPase
MATNASRRRRSPRTPGPRSSAGESLVARSPAGELLHVALPRVTSALRATVARLRLSHELPDRFGVVSAIRGEGVTFISRSLALVLANDTREKVCLVDFNFRHPARLGAGFEGRPGLAEVLRGSASLHDALAATADPALTILPAGTATVEEPPVFASSPELEMVLEDLDRRYDHMVIDLPSLHASSEALTLASHATGVAVVVRQGVTSEAQVKAALEELEGVPVLGVVLNAFETKVPAAIARRFPTT